MKFDESITHATTVSTATGHNYCIAVDADENYIVTSSNELVNGADYEMSADAVRACENGDKVAELARQFQLGVTPIRLWDEDGEPIPHKELLSRFDEIKYVFCPTSKSTERFLELTDACWEFGLLQLDTEYYKSSWAPHKPTLFHKRGVYNFSQVENVWLKLFGLSE